MTENDDDDDDSEIRYSTRYAESLATPLPAADFDRERTAVLAAAVGIARLRLSQGRADQALEVLDSAAKKTRALHWQFLHSERYEDNLIALLVGPERGES